MQSLLYINFKFIPPRSPHWDGIWEAAIKSDEHHLSRLMSNTCFSFEIFYTILTQIVATLNSRPLYALSNDPNDMNCLTPGYFLTGISLNFSPERNVTEL